MMSLACLIISIIWVGCPETWIEIIPSHAAYWGLLTLSQCNRGWSEVEQIPWSSIISGPIDHNVSALKLRTCSAFFMYLLSKPSLPVWRSSVQHRLIIECSLGTGSYVGQANILEPWRRGFGCLALPRFLYPLVRCLLGVMRGSSGDVFHHVNQYGGEMFCPSAGDVCKSTW